LDSEKVKRQEKVKVEVKVKIAELVA